MIKRKSTYLDGNYPVQFLGIAFGNRETEALIGLPAMPKSEVPIQNHKDCYTDGRIGQRIGDKLPSKGALT